MNGVGGKNITTFLGVSQWIIQSQVSEQLGQSHSFLKINKLLPYTFNKRATAMKAQTFCCCHLPPLLRSGRQTKLTPPSQPSLPAIRPGLNTNTSWGREGRDWKSVTSLVCEAGEDGALKHTQMHKHTQLFRRDPVPCSCLKRPSRMELKQMLEVL